MYDTRRQVLECIRQQQQATVASLSEALKLTAIAVRHHLNTLQAEGLVKAEVERGGVGRPRHLYSLTESALQRSSTRYHILAERLLDELKATIPLEQLHQIIDGVGAHAAARYGAQDLNLPLGQRLERLLEILGEEGFRAQVQYMGDQMVLAGVNCPYAHVGQRHPEVCRIDRAMIESVLGVEVRQSACVLHGDGSCAFSIAPNEIN